MPDSGKHEPRPQNRPGTDASRPDPVRPRDDDEKQPDAPRPEPGRPRDDDEKPDAPRPGPVEPHNDMSRPDASGPEPVRPDEKHPAPPPGQEVLRVDDLLSLRIELVNLQLEATSDGLQLRRGNGDAFVILHFPPPRPLGSRSSSKRHQKGSTTVTDV